MKYPEEVKQKVIKRLNNGDKVKQISEDMGISPATIYGWRKRFGNTVEEKTNSDEKAAKIVSEDVKVQEEKSKNVTRAERKIVNRKPINTDEAEKERRRQKLLGVLKAKIKYDKIEPADIEEIRQSEVLSQYEKTICLLAICEKCNMQKRAKRFAREFETEDKEQRKMINIIVERIKSNKNKIFDIAEYNRLLGWKSDRDLKEKFKLEVKAKGEKEREEFVSKCLKGVKSNQDNVHNEGSSNIASSKDSSNVVGVRKREETYIEDEKIVSRRRGFYQEIRYIPPKMAAKSMSKVKGNKEQGGAVTNKKEDKVVSRKNTILEYLNEKKKDIYLKMQSKDAKTQAEGIKQWDMMEHFIEKVKNGAVDEEILYKKIQILQSVETRKMNRAEKEEVIIQINNLTEADTDR